MRSVRPRYNVRRFYLFVDPPTYDRRCQFLLHPVSSGALETDARASAVLLPASPLLSAVHSLYIHQQRQLYTATGTQPAPAPASAPLAGVLLAPASAHSYSYHPGTVGTNRPPHPHPEACLCVLPIFTRLHMLRGVPGLAVPIRLHAHTCPDVHAARTAGGL
ncbi:hypothetical protein B0H14DRAFT_655731 [Mycena olivaceomarginata]|nr:hypothetical protein B0H14DRAFT_655731 [Mycena olivaceomarginata]